MVSCSSDNRMFSPLSERPRELVFCTTLWEKELAYRKRNWILGLYAKFSHRLK